jgi:hypothetical protein
VEMDGRLVSARSLIGAPIGGLFSILTTGWDRLLTG